MGQVGGFDVTDSVESSRVGVTSADGLSSLKEALTTLHNNINEHQQLLSTNNSSGSGNLSSSTLEISFHENESIPISGEGTDGFGLSVGGTLINLDELDEKWACETYGLPLPDALHKLIESGSSNLESTLSSLYVNSNDTLGSPNDSVSSENMAIHGSSLGIDLRNASNIGPSGNNSACPNNWDGILCWLETPVGHSATLSCFGELNTILYDSSNNVTRFCDEALNGSGIWQKSDYDFCSPINQTTGPDDGNLLALTTLTYFCGYMVSLAALIFAIIIFVAFKELRCLRNTIHTQLIITYILADTLWIITSSTTFTSSALPEAPKNYKHASMNGTFPVPSGSAQSIVSCATFILLHYFHLTNFFWMFVEGLYLYVLVVQTFVAENIKLRVYIFIGWGLPTAIVFAWALVKWLTTTPAPSTADKPTELDVAWWLAVNYYDWIYKSPVIITLASNSIFLLQIMWVLITKLRSATNPETQQSVKAAKALVVLMPLLGITYLLILSGSREPIYEFIRALLISTQGFLVALLYCFLNGEVRVALRHRWNRLRTMGPGGGTSCCDFGRRRQMQQMRDWSPRSRTESIRLYTPAATHNFRKRESSCNSEATTMTTLHGSMNSNGTGGMMGHRLSTTYLPASQKFYNNVNSSMEGNNTFI